MAYPGAKMSGDGSSTVGAPVAGGFQPSPPTVWHKPQIARPMWANQASLPRLPVPPLEQTVAMYLRSVRPLCTPAEWERTRKAAAEFLTDGSGEELQERLLKRQTQKGDTSWLVDWWNELSYLGYRDPVVVWVNYFYQFRPDKWSGMQQCTRAAGFVKAALRYRDLVTSGDLPCEMSGKTPQDMSMYQFLFNACRVPEKGKDHYVTYDPAAYHHIIVMCKRRAYVVQTRDAAGAELSMGDLAGQLQKVLADADAKGAAEFPVGALTADSRDPWTAARVALEAAGNKPALEAIWSAVLLVCLDDESPRTADEHARLLWHSDGRSRWFDKPLEFIVARNGQAGFNGEHGLMDGTPTTSLCDWVLTQLDKGKIPRGTDRGPQPPPTELRFTLTDALKKSIRAAEQGFDKLIAGQQINVLDFNEFGKDRLKTFKVSPDAFIQMAYQLTYTKMTGKRAPTYESCSVRGYLHGRTETIRSCHIPGCRFVDAMLDGKAPAATKYKLLQAAAAHQGAYARAATAAQGCDRHLMGLKLLRKDGEKPDIFEDPVYSRSSSWILSTSTLNCEHFSNWGFGEVVPDGLGIGYMAHKKSLAVTTSSLTTLNPGAKEFATLLQQTFRDMAAVCDEALKAPASKM